MKRLFFVIAAIYLVGYAVLRTANAEVWDQDNHVYVLFPKNPIALYYLYRPLTYIDGAMTGMRFHIGPHR